MTDLSDAALLGRAEANTSCDGRLCEPQRHAHGPDCAVKARLCDYLALRDEARAEDQTKLDDYIELATKTQFDLVEMTRQRDAARAEYGNPKPCVECEGADCERCGGTGFYCVGCPTYGRAADMWQALLKTVRAEQREQLRKVEDLLTEAIRLVEDDWLGTSADSEGNVWIAKAGVFLGAIRAQKDTP